jgi:DNA-directed RNA polymerase specialized sigma subunit
METGFRGELNQREIIKQLYKEGLKQIEIAKRFGVSKSTICKVIKGTI